MSKTYKVIVIGGTSVGKTCLVYRYTEKNYVEQDSVTHIFFIIKHPLSLYIYI